MNEQEQWSARLSRALDDPATEALFLETAGAFVASVLTTPLGLVADRGRIDAALSAWLSDDAIEATWQPALAWLLRDVTRRASDCDTSIGELIGDDAVEGFATLAARSDLIDEALLREIATDPALESVMRDVLFDALKAFNERSNPFVAPWGVPALLDALPAIGRSAVRKAFDGVRNEFERRLEPEMRKFLAGFAAKSLQHTVDVATDKAADPELVAWRQRVARVLLAQTVKRAVWAAEDERGRALIDAVKLTPHALGHAELRRRINRACDDAIAATENQSLTALASAHGIALPDPEPILRAAWPLVRATLATQPVRDALARALVAVAGSAPRD